MDRRLEEKINELLEKTCYVIDYLPETVPVDAKGQYFKVESYLLNNFKRFRIYDKFVSTILKVMCYYHVVIQWNGWLDQPSPNMVTAAVEEIMCNHSGTLNILLPEENALLVFEWDCLNLSVYNPNCDMKRIMRSVAQSEGLFWRESSI